MPQARFTLVEARSGSGDLMRCGAVLGRVRYQLDRYQGMLEGSGMPIPGLHRLEGRIDLDDGSLPSGLVGESLTLRLEDGRTIDVTLAGSDGRILAEGHGPGRGCSCC
jgi:hypothetical protein